MSSNPSLWLPSTAEEIRARGWDAPDVVFVTGDAYVDHPSFAMAVLSRMLESHGFRVAILPQPDWRSVAAWRELGTDAGARFDRSVPIDVNRLAPIITYGTTPAMAIPIDQPVPDAGSGADRRALDYMALEPGKPLLGHPIDVVFIGSCTNSRLSDLVAAAGVMRGRRVAPGVRMLVVPGSREVKRQAESLGIDRDFLAAGADWREPGCSMCIAMNGDELDPGQYAVSTSNRNFEGRQGRGGRTFLASPLTAAAAAVTGCITDPRTLIGAIDA